MRRIKGYFYVFLIMLIALNIKELNFQSTHFFSQLIATLGCLLVLTFKLNNFEREQNDRKLGRVILGGVLIGYIFYHLENYIF
ncbi:hypothetical protein [Kurthia gibsonii]|uniref:hypothetical protein n=1 Tax=Kurthia gibsonii TaxID=33946 RepID=UPI002DB9FADD|nr:hypothetical protein [Kurthia gibsonii]MEB7771527.1 hypothetical protein [Kurthia gibsonii]